MLRIRLIALSLVFAGSFQAISQSISPLFFGQNAWMPDSIGNKRLNGQLHNNWHHIQASGAQTVRFGGIAPDDERPTNHQYIKMIDAIRSRGMEPIMQVPYFNGKWSASQAAAIVHHVNITMNRNIKYWIIGNEPDHKYGHTTSSQVAPYLRSFSYAMKNTDPSIKIIGPETAWYNHSILRGLTTPGGSDDVTGKDNKGRFIIDYISFHCYPFSGGQTRQNVIDNLMQSGKFNDNLIELKGRLANCNAYHNRTGSNALKMGVTEANVNYMNNSNDNLQGHGATSFIGGQFWVEMMDLSLRHGVEFFNFWSVIEGNNQQLNIGYLDRLTAQRQPTWHHFKMMADNFRGTYSRGTSSHNRIKVVGSKSTATQIAVMVMNQSSSANIDYRLRLNTGTVSGSNTAKLNIDAGVGVEYNDVIQNQSTMLLIFDHAGNLMKKCEYRMNGHANNNLPPACTNFAPTANISASGPTDICDNQSVTLSTQNNSGYTYQWRSNGTNISGATSHSINVNTAGSYTLVVTQSGSSSTSNTINVTVATTAAATASITSTNPQICSGNSVTFTATVNNGGPNPTYQWRRNGNIVSTNSPTYTTSSLQNNDNTVCIITSNRACVTGSPATSNSIIVKVTPATNAAVEISPSDTLVCDGMPITFIAKPLNEGSSPVYQWKRNGVNVGSNTASYSLQNPSDNDVIEVEMASNKACVQNAMATSASNPIKVQSTIAIANALGHLNFCDGDSVMLSANSGSGFSYQWYRNNKQINWANSSTFKAVADGNYKVAVTQHGCTETSNELIVVVTPWPAPEVKVSGLDDLCQTQSIYLHVDDEPGHTYQWKIDSVSIPSAQDYFYEASAPGIYSVEVSNQCGIVTSDGYTINPCLHTGMENLDSPHVRFFPNPTNGRLTVELININNENVKFEILNSLGQVVMLKEKQAMDGKVTSRFTFKPDLAAGIYFLKVSAGDYNFNTRIILTREN
ncbi:MAG: T9SS type A sorting domain-containing protein [Bacteroidetes bacterium]|nr:T9SS type A sorting domain-containing protein [Bacteroidota bacterium]